MVRLTFPLILTFLAMQSAAAVEGLWDAWLDVPGGKLRFGLEFVSSEEGLDAYLINAGTDALVPSKNDPHPVRTDLLARLITTSDETNGICRVVTQYTRSSGSISSTLESTEPPTNNSEGIVWNLTWGLESRPVTVDRNGVRIFVTRPSVESARFGPELRYFEAERLSVVGVLKGVRRELNPPMSRMRVCAGKLNSFAHGPYAARTLLCYPPIAETDNTAPNPTPASYNGWHKVTYEFHYNPDTWDQTYFWTRDDGSQPPVHEPGLSEKVYEVYEQENFETELDLDFGDPT